MADIDVKLDFKNFSRYRRALDKAALQPILEKHVASRTKLIGLHAEKLVRKLIKASGVPPPNAALTAFIKGSSKPLVDHGQVFQSVTSQQQAWNQIFVGILRKDKNYNIAEALHDGKDIPVTDKMRTMFFYLWLASTGRYDPAKLTGRAAELWLRRPALGWFPLKEDTRIIKIPARPFIKQVFEGPELRGLAEKHWANAVREALFELTQGREYTSSYRKGLGGG